MTDQALTSRKPGNDFFIVGGTYREICAYPVYQQLVGSGLRAALALSEAIPNLNFKTCLAEADIDDFLEVAAARGIRSVITPTTATIIFSYLHPLKKPAMYPQIAEEEMFRLEKFQAERVLCYGMAEAITPVESTWLVYDPQSLIPFESTGSKSKHLALILNKKEAAYFCKTTIESDINQLGNQLINDTDAEVVVIKNGAAGAWVFENEGITHIPVFRTPEVWPIGSGDIFSAVFAWQWMLERQSPAKAARMASRFTATYCATKQLPLPARPANYPAPKFKADQRPIYLAGPFFTQAERWLIEELKETLEDFGHNVFSPFHEVGTEGGAKAIAEADLAGN